MANEQVFDLAPAVDEYCIGGGFQEIVRFARLKVLHRCCLCRGNT
jgi:hypothetical protein